MESSPRYVAIHQLPWNDTTHLMIYVQSGHRGHWVGRYGPELDSQYE